MRTGSERAPRRRSGKNNVFARAVTEARAGRFDVDVVHNPSRKWSSCTASGLLQEVRSPFRRS